MRASERAADLTRQLLAYAGKGRFVMRVVDLSELVRDISGLVQTSIPKTVQIRLNLADDIPGIEADAGQLQQIVMNLVINGAEAVGPEGGTVLVRTGAQEVDEPYIRTLTPDGEHLRPGPYVMLEVHDTGGGMSPETLAKIFDPFFTTKFTGRGLGLSAVQGIVRAHHGALKVYTPARPRDHVQGVVSRVRPRRDPDRRQIGKQSGRPRHGPDRGRRGHRTADRQTHAGTLWI